MSASRCNAESTVCHTPEAVHRRKRRRPCSTGRSVLANRATVLPYAESRGFHLEFGDDHGPGGPCEGAEEGAVEPIGPTALGKDVSVTLIRLCLKRFWRATYAVDASFSPTIPATVPSTESRCSGAHCRVEIDPEVFGILDANAES
jgi:hypothetical protein